MNPSILKPGKYNKITKKNKDKKDNIIKKQIKKNKIYREKDNNTLLKFFLSAFAIVCIILLITYIPKIDTKKIMAVFTREDNVKEKLIAGYNFKIGINNLDENKNIVVRELNKFANRRLINISDNYDIIYDFAFEIKKIDNKTYEIYLKDNIDLSEKIKKINNVLDVKYNKKVLTVSLKNDDPYFVYSLDFDLGMDNLYKYSDLKYTSNINNYLKEINLKNYLDSDEMVKDFREDNLDMFLTSKESDLRLIGKHEYSQKKYRDGEMYTLFINKDSEFLKNIDVRKGISYGINRNRIIKETLPLFSELIDVPYVYSEIKYNYDTIGAKNSIIKGGYTYVNGNYIKDNKKLELKLIVNKNDSNKIKIANYIKEDLHELGVIVNIELLDDITTNNYDLVLMSLNINNNPDLTYLYNYININKNIDDAIKNIYNSTIDTLPLYVRNLRDILVSEVACYSISAKNVSVIFQKYIKNINDVKYLNIFNNINNIGRIENN